MFRLYKPLSSDVDPAGHEDLTPYYWSGSQAGLAFMVATITGIVGACVGRKVVGGSDISWTLASYKVPTVTLASGDPARIRYGCNGAMLADRPVPSVGTRSSASGAEYG